MASVVRYSYASHRVERNHIVKSKVIVPVIVVVILVVIGLAYGLTAKSTSNPTPAETPVPASTPIPAETPAPTPMATPESSSSTSADGTSTSADAEESTGEKYEVSPGVYNDGTTRELTLEEYESLTPEEQKAWDDASLKELGGKEADEIPDGTEGALEAMENFNLDNPYIQDIINSGCLGN